MSLKLSGRELEEIKRAKEWAERLPSPNTLNIDVLPESIVDMLLEMNIIRDIKVKNNYFWCFSFPTIGDIDFVKKIGKDDCLSTVEAWNQFNKTNNEKEKEKMNAKKCDRCGKLYIETNEPIKAYLCGRVTDNEKGTYTPEKIKEFNTFNIKIVLNSIDEVDMCPECREKLKEFFESGADEAKE